MSISFTPSQVIVIAQCHIYGSDQANDSYYIAFWKLPEAEQSAIANVSRAYDRFVREFAFYEALSTNGRWCGKGVSTLPVVRQYHRLLINSIKTLESLRKKQDLE